MIKWNHYLTFITQYVAHGRNSITCAISSLISKPPPQHSFIHSLRECVYTCTPCGGGTEGWEYTQRLYSTFEFSLEYCFIWGVRRKKETQRERERKEGRKKNEGRKKERKGKKGRKEGNAVVYIAYLANFQKKLIITDYAHIGTSAVSQNQNVFSHFH